MSKLANAIKTVHKNTVEWMKNPGNISSKIKLEKRNIEQWQKFDPGAKYLGVTGIPGVRPQKQIKKEEDRENLAVIKEEERIHPDPYITSTGESIARRRRAGRRGGRLSTILSASEGDGGLG